MKRYQLHRVRKWSKLGFAEQEHGGGNCYGAKYPLMSRMTLVELLTNIDTAPLLPAGTIAAFATTLPWNEFSVETSGCDCPVGQAVRYVRGPAGTTVTF